ncbi:FAD-binding and (Fe-S)-binding domain-containing protein [Phytoactinopolyspora limicola]|uniref:FAD-binding and (Fe-S)-binding domain-containing protein n=1 Tax=Phytoactinopolyspora limicola TaxID=2715536 RepID=UPI00140AB651|nr:FAD-binding and (Fe-S)-binding domain-containing protein [Phytoactinopolyspora limicola]
MIPDDEQARRLVRQLRSNVAGDVEDGPAARAVYSMDASNYRHVPAAVLFPRSTDDVVAALRLSHEHGVPVTARGAGTGIGGGALGRGLVLDFTRYLNQVLEIDPEQHIARVRPGVVLDGLRSAAAPYGLTFGPDPSTHSRCTIGGMIGNDACGSHSVAWGRTSDNVVRLDVLTADGTRMSVGHPTSDDPADLAAQPGRKGEIHRGLQELVAQNLALLRTGFPVLPRRVSGYALDHLLPENGGNLVRALIGTEGTCVLVMEATVGLVPAPAARVLVVAGYQDDVAAADAAPQVLPLGPLTVEGMGADLIEAMVARGRRPAALGELPDGGGWLFVEVGGDSADDAIRRGRQVARALRRATGATTTVAHHPAHQRELWAIREAAAGIATRMADGSEAWPGWEDAAVPPERLGGYLREFRALLREHDLRGIPYGHFGEGCLHVRIDFELTTSDGRRRYRTFVEEAADLVVAHGGSLSGEHGDGQARAELLPRMYPPAMIDLFERFKGVWDPDGRLNPGVLVRPRPLDADLRFDGPVRQLPITLRYPHDDGGLATATRRCVGVGACIDTSSGVMCPSYMVTGREEHSTRGRARLLAEMMRGETVPDGWRSTEVRDALDLCLACKGCLSDCPVHVDMATYKAEFLHHHYANRVRPASHYTLGYLPAVARLAALAPGAANTMLRMPGVAPVFKWAGGIAPERPVPSFAPTTLRRMLRRRRRGSGDGRPAVMLWPDTFTNYFTPDVGVAAVRVLEHAGFDVRLPRGPVCCGLTWMSTGQLGTARRVLRRTVRALRPGAGEAVPIVGVEPSCLAMLRHDARELLPDGELDGVPDRVYTLAGFLAEYAPDTAFVQVGAAAIAQQHCHQHAVFGNVADEQVLNRAGVNVRTLDSGCCGLAGNFGMEKGHYDVSVAAARRVLVPEVEAASPEAIVLADGFSCRTQIEHLTGRRAVHLAEVLARALPPGRP